MATTMEEESRQRDWNDNTQEQQAYTDGRGYRNGRVVNGVEYPNIDSNSRPVSSTNFQAVNMRLGLNVVEGKILVGLMCRMV